MTEPSVSETVEDADQHRWQSDDIDLLVRQLTELRGKMLGLEARAAETLRSLASDRQPSARNLLHYVELRRHDIRELQEQLVVRGLSSLGRCESHVLENIEAVLNLLGRESSEGVTRVPAAQVPVDFRYGRELLRQSTIRLLGETGHAEPQIMVTMPEEAGHDYSLVRDLLGAGMRVMRINCAHDDAATWKSMIDNLRRAEEELGRPCRIAMDLAGPKIRTGPIEDGPRVMRWRPTRNEYGVVVAPARLWISPNPEACPDENIDCAPSRYRRLVEVGFGW